MERKKQGLNKKSSSSTRARSIQSLDSDLLCKIFSLVDPFDLARCSSVCKFWHNVINTSNILKVLYYKQQHGSMRHSNLSARPETSLQMHLESLAMEQHKLSLQKGFVFVDQWKGHSAGVEQCRMKMGLILTGVGDKVETLETASPAKQEVMRIWSSESYKCLEEYPVPDKFPLVDFDFDESKIVGLIGTRICIWRRHGGRSIFPSHEGTVTNGLCMRYIDPEAVVGCEDGTVRVFDMYSRNCSQIIRTRAGSVMCLALTDQLVLGGSSLGSITVASLSSGDCVASLKATYTTGSIWSLCFNPRSHLVFSGSSAGYSHCWDLRTMRPLWEKRVSPNVVYSLQHQTNDTSVLIVGGIDGVLRTLDQNTGEILASYVLHEGTRATSSENRYGVIERKKAIRLSEDTLIDSIPKHMRPPISCLAVGMKKVVTTHSGKLIRMWRFNK